MSTPEPPPYPSDSNAAPPPAEPPGGGQGSGPPPPPPPAPPSYGGPQAFSPPDAIAWGWTKFKDNTGPVILAVVVIVAVTIGIGLIGGLFTGGMEAAMFDPEDPMGVNPFAIAMSPLQLALQIGQTVVSIVLGGVAAKAALEVTEGKPFDFFGAFSRINILQLVLASLVVTIATFIGLLLCVIPGIIVMFLTYLSTYSIVDDGKSAFDGIKHSVQLTSSNVSGALLMAILNFLVCVAGLLALCVGLIVAIPVTIFATAYTYRSFNGQAVAA